MPGIGGIRYPYIRGTAAAAIGERRSVVIRPDSAGSVITRSTVGRVRAAGKRCPGRRAVGAPAYSAQQLWKGPNRGHRITVAVLTRILVRGQSHRVGAAQGNSRRRTLARRHGDRVGLGELA